jgi:hypothetical protein
LSCFISTCWASGVYCVRYSGNIMLLKCDITVHAFLGVLYEVKHRMSYVKTT